MMGWLHSILGKVRENSLLRGFSVLMGGTAVTQALSILAAPVLTRLYTPGDYGANAVYIAMLSVCGVAATLRLQVPIAMSHDPRERAILFRLLVGSSVVASLFIALVLVLWAGTIQQMVGLKSVDALLVLPLGTLMFGLYEAMQQSLLSLRRYRTIARMNALSVASQVALQLVLALAGMGFMGLIIGNLFSYFVSCGYMALSLQSANRGDVPIAWREYFSTLRRYADFPRFALPAELASMGSYSLVPVAISNLFGLSAAGHYALANRLLGIPIQLIGNSLRQVFIREASDELRSNGTVAGTFGRTLRILSIVAIPTAIVLYAVAPWMFALIFGPEWSVAGAYVRAMTLMFVARFIVGPLVSTANVIGRQRLGLWMQLGLLAVVILAAWIGAVRPGSSALTFLIMLSTAYAVIHGLFLTVVGKLIRRMGEPCEPASPA